MEGPPDLKKVPAAPSARSEGLIVEQLPEELVVYDQQSHRVHCLGPIAAWIWKACDGRTSLARLAKRASDRFGHDVDAGQVSAVIDRLLRARLLEGPRPPEVRDRSRRELLKRAARLSAGLSIVSLTAPTPAQAATCIPIGQRGCTASSQCCPNANGVRCCRNGRCALIGGPNCAPG